MGQLIPFHPPPPPPFPFDSKFSMCYVKNVKLVWDPYAQVCMMYHMLTLSNVHFLKNNKKKLSNDVCVGQ